MTNEEDAQATATLAKIGTATVGAIAAPILVIGMSLVFAPLVIWEAWAAKVIWNWYVPAFGGPIANTAAFVAIILVHNLIRYRYKETPNDTFPKFFKRVMFSVISPIISLASAWVIGWFVL